MVATLLVTLALSGGDVSVTLSPAARFARAVAEAIGPTTTTISLEVEEPLRAERDALVDALGATGLFTLVSDAPVVVTARRVDDDTVGAVVTRAGAITWRGEVAWPARPVAPDAPLEAERETRLLAYQRSRVTVRSKTAIVQSPPLYLGQGRYSDPMWQDRWTETDIGASAPIPVYNDWVVVRGDDTELDELDFAHHIGDASLAAAVTERRRDLRLRWLVGFGSGAVVAGAAGGWLVWTNRGDGGAERNLQTVGLSLLTLGALSAVMTLFYGNVGTDPILTQPEAARRCERYNARLRHDLDLSPTEVSTLSASRGE